MKVIAILCLCLGAALSAPEPEQQSCVGFPETGMCLAYIPMYYYDPSTDSCKQFIYGGCQGNGNRYVTEAQCLRKCKGSAQHAADICSLEPESGPCRGKFPRYYFDKTEGECKEMIYGGCRGNANRFRTLEACQDQCNPTETPEKREASKIVCSLEPETGPCRAAFRKFYFDAKSGECKIFTYGGCLGNGNRFSTAEECNNACNVNKQVSKDVCSLKPEIGVCNARFFKFYFDVKSGKCKVFVYGSCGGNDNKFNTIEECHATCKVARSASPNCSDEPKKGLCRGYFPRYYYDVRFRTCREFVFGGCGGNGNNYETKEACENACGAF